jgi:hypothetical protein
MFGGQALEVKSNAHAIGGAAPEKADQLHNLFPSLDVLSALPRGAQNNCAPAQVNGA